MRKEIREYREPKRIPIDWAKHEKVHTTKEEKEKRQPKIRPRGNPYYTKSPPLGVCKIKGCGYWATRDRKGTGILGVCAIHRTKIRNHAKD